MPVPDSFERFHDFFQCPFCEKDYSDKYLKSAFIKINDSDVTGRACHICRFCLEKAKQDKEYDKFVTDKAFREKIGRSARLCSQKKKG